MSLNMVDVQTEILAKLDELSDAATISSKKNAVYAAQIDVLKLHIDAALFPCNFVNFRGDDPGDTITPEDEEFEFNILICTASKDGLTEAMTEADILKTELRGTWDTDSGVFDVYIGKIVPVFNLKLKQVLSLPLRIVA